MTPQHPLAASEACAAVSARWARCLGASVRLSPVAEVVGPLPCVAVARFIGAPGLSLEVPAHLLAGQVQALAGLAPRPSGPVPLSEAEAGLFAYLALEAAAALPTLDLVLADVDATPGRAARTIAVWSAQIGDQRGVIRWTTPAPSPSERARSVPLALRVTRVLAARPSTVRPGAALVLDGAPWRLEAGGRPVLSAQLERTAEPAAWRLHVDPSDAHLHRPKEDTMPIDPADLPCALTLDLGTVVLPAGVVADLAPGDRVPLSLDAPPRIWLRVGEAVVAEGELVDLAGTPAVRIIRSLLSPR